MSFPLGKPIEPGQSFPELQQGSSGNNRNGIIEKASLNSTHELPTANQNMLNAIVIGNTPSSTSDDSEVSTSEDDQSDIDKDSTKDVGMRSASEESGCEPETNKDRMFKNSSPVKVGQGAKDYVPRRSARSCSSSTARKVKECLSSSNLLQESMQEANETQPKIPSASSPLPKGKKRAAKKSETLNQSQTKKQRTTETPAVERSETPSTSTSAKKSRTKRVPSAKGIEIAREPDDKFILKFPLPSSKGKNKSYNEAVVKNVLSNDVKKHLHTFLGKESELLAQAANGDLSDIEFSFVVKEIDEDNETVISPRNSSTPNADVAVEKTEKEFVDKSIQSESLIHTLTEISTSPILQNDQIVNRQASQPNLILSLRSETPLHQQAHQKQHQEQRRQEDQERLSEQLQLQQQQHQQGEQEQRKQDPKQQEHRYHQHQHQRQEQYNHFPQHQQHQQQQQYNLHDQFQYQQHQQISYHQRALQHLLLPQPMQTPYAALPQHFPQGFVGYSAPPSQVPLWYPIPPPIGGLNNPQTSNAQEVQFNGGLTQSSPTFASTYQQSPPIFLSSHPERQQIPQDNHLIVTSLNPQLSSKPQ